MMSCSNARCACAGDGVSEEAVDAIAESLAQFNSVLADASNDPTSETIIQIINRSDNAPRSALRLVTDELMWRPY